MVQTKKMFTLCSGEKMIILISSRVAVFFHKLNLTFEEFWTKTHTHFEWASLALCSDTFDKEMRLFQQVHYSVFFVFIR